VDGFGGGAVVFDVTLSTDGGQVVVVVAGDIDMISAGVLREALGKAVRSAGTGETVVDLTAVAFMDSSGVQALLDAYHTAMVAGGTLSVRGARGTAERVLNIVGLARLFGVRPPEDMAG
jgi:anti-anti-sigma factor